MLNEGLIMMPEHILNNLFQHISMNKIRITLKFNGDLYDLILSYFSKFIKLVLKTLYYLLIKTSFFFIVIPHFN